MYTHRTKSIFYLFIFVIFLTNCSYDSFQTQVSKNQNIKDWFINTKFGKIEASVTWPFEKGYFPSLLMIHSSVGNNQKKTKELLSLVGYPIIAMSISLPGFGNSTGPDDFGGKKSVKSISRSISYLSKMYSIRERSVFLYAKGFGANAAIIAATKNPEVQLVIVENGIFQPRRVVRKIPRNIRFRLKNFLADGDYKINFRSCLKEVEKLQTPIFIIQNASGKDYELKQLNKLIASLKLHKKRYKIMEIREKTKKQFFQRKIIKKRILPIIEKHINKEIKYN